MEATEGVEGMKLERLSKAEIDRIIYLDYPEDHPLIAEVLALREEGEVYSQALNALKAWCSVRPRYSTEAVDKLVVALLQERYLDSQIVALTEAVRVSRKAEATTDPTPDLKASVLKLEKEVAELKDKLEDSNYWRVRWSNEAALLGERNHQYFLKYGTIEGGQPPATYAHIEVETLLECVQGLPDPRDGEEYKLYTSVDDDLIDTHEAAAAVQASRIPKL